MKRTIDYDFKHILFIQEFSHTPGVQYQNHTQNSKTVKRKHSKENPETILPAEAAGDDLKIGDDSGQLGLLAVLGNITGPAS
ncbi:hypothetical protein M0R45_037121 [Rubus argutus]|uniref:Uncharacterized protein n=1 Tax=Rubus argutus TaxID=59490 RepID=A0AAW1VY54_RUBAR